MPTKNVNNNRQQQLKILHQLPDGPSEPDHLKFHPLYHQLGVELYAAFQEARKHKLKTGDEFKFEAHFVENIDQLRRDILTERYHPNRGIAFVTQKPVIREIFAAPFRDRVVHHLIFSHIGPWWDRRFIYDSYSCRDNKGTDFGIRRLYHHMRKVSRNFQRDTYVIKFDIQGYFMSLPRRRLYERAIWGLKRQYDESTPLYNMLRYLLAETIFDDPTNGVIRRNPHGQGWSKLPNSKSLFCQPPGKGIVIGNLTSQLMSNIYLDQLDQFVVNTLKIKSYGRYVDDFYFVVPSEDLSHFKKKVTPMIEDFIIGLELKLHPNKRFCQPLWHGVPFLGMRIYPYHVLPDYRLINNYRKAVERVCAGVDDIGVLISYMGFLQHTDSQHLQKKIWESVGWDYQMDRKLGPNSIYYTDPKTYNKRKFWK